MVADTSRDLPPRTRLLREQPVIVMPTMQAKIDAQVRGIGVGHLPLTLAAPYLAQGLLATCPTDDVVPLTEQVVYAWRDPNPGRALQWWLERLRSPRLCESLLGVS